ncbi:hypothetical protein AV926_18485 [Myroides marinus]|uniref:Meiotically up-regulated gene 113 n=1 Tax=Myroides marinus TaxID=703342 RepID=A0A163U2P3_9FLAO|nr:GIY-YIG nuclease family protein [Myroides marinus]KZE72731.1 hypothetical protein AV926_18485 [Myroides marinus]
MENPLELIEKFNNLCFTLSEEDIFELDKEDNGPIHNVISNINRHCFGVKLFDDENGLAVEMYYINNDSKLKGDIICLDLNDPDYFQLLLQFCVLLSDDYDGVDSINAFNIYQTRLRSFLEKSGFHTTTSLELKMFKDNHTVFASASKKRGFINVKMIDRVEFYRKFYNNNYLTEIFPEKDYVYLMVNDDTSFIKIGTSKKPNFREKTLQSQEPNIHMIALWCCDKKLEKELHSKFAVKRIRGEWFRLSFKDLKHIEDFMSSKTGTAVNNSLAK